MLSERQQAHTLQKHSIAPEFIADKRLFFERQRTGKPQITSHSASLQQEDYTFTSTEERQREQKQDQHAYYPNAFRQRGDASEHMLRRKTPNGTLAAGYDGRPMEWMSKPHSTKHVRMPPSKAIRDTSPRADICTQNKEGHSIHGSRSFAARAGPFQGWGDTQHPAVWSHRASLSNNEIDVSVGHNNPSLGGMDSVLHQSSLHTYPFNAMTYQSVPTVLQPLWPPCLRPTSLHASGPFGPYWPNGAYEPYRPAPLRDVTIHNGSWSVQSPCYVSHSSRLDRSREFLSTNDPRNITLDQHATRRNDYNVFPVREGLHSASLPQEFHSKLAISQDLPRKPMLTFCEPNENTKESTKASNLRRDFPASPSTSSGQAQFKERILHWAYRIYCSLLASIETTRRDSQAKNKQATVSPSHMHIPRRPYPSWSSKHYQPESSQHLSDVSTDAFRSDGEVSLCNGALLQNEDRTHYNNNDFPSASPFASDRSYDLSGGDPCQRSRQIHPQRFRPQPNPGNPSYIPPQLNQSPSTVSPRTAAANAMEILSRLCRESCWEWLDGMLLNGCLAYGLGDFIRATNWYLKVLRQDPNNVEAMSNLAATLLALGRRHEAEQHWMRSIQLRPSYFEAVEHLVGLLHEEHRTKEAVALIEYIESALSARTPSNVRPQESIDSSTPCKFDGYAIPPSDNGRLLALIHGKGNVLYQSGDNDRAARAFEDAISIGTGRRPDGIRGLISHILNAFSEQKRVLGSWSEMHPHHEPALLPPEAALETSRLVFPPDGNLPGLEDVPLGMGQKAAVSIISNSLLSLAKIYQDGMSSSGASATTARATSGVQEILVLYYLSLALQPSPSTANNVGILLAGVQQSGRACQQAIPIQSSEASISGVVPGSGVALALAYYDYGLKLDPRHAHLYTNLGSLFKDIGQLSAAIKMYEKAVDCDGNFDIALANLANAVKDKGGIKDAIHYYKRAVASNPDFAEAVCGLANALNSVCSWTGRGGISCFPSTLDRWHVDENSILYDSQVCSAASSGWMERVVAIVEKQLRDGKSWGKGILWSVGLEHMLRQICGSPRNANSAKLQKSLESWSDEPWEGAKVVRLVERATRNITWQIYQEKHGGQSRSSATDRARPRLPLALAIPSAPTVLPFHTFTCPLTAKQIRQISQRNGLRVSCTTLRAPWLPSNVYEAPGPPNPQLNVGYISSDFNNHPLAHLMQSVFGLHDPMRVKAICYATTASDSSIHRKQIERESPIFHDASSWSIERLVNQVVADSIHILVNLNGYTRGAKNEVFAARAAPIQMSFMGFAGTLGAEWCDYLLADKIAIPPKTLRPFRGNLDLQDLVQDENNRDDQNDWVYGENIIFTRDTFFCCDHRQSAPDVHEDRWNWPEEQRRRWEMRKKLFPDLPDDAVILGNFNQLYKIEPTTFRSWLRILSRVPKAILWLLRFPELGEQHLRQTALQWGGAEVASRIIFTDVAPKQQHIARARVCDLFVDTPECNAHTTAADVLWSGTPLLTLPRYEYKMCARMAASILRGALPKNAEGDRAAEDLIAANDEAYEEQGVELASDLYYPLEEAEMGFGRGRLVELRKLLYESRWTSPLFDTKRWVQDLELAYNEAWRRWVARQGGDIWL